MTHVFHVLVSELMQSTTQEIQMKHQSVLLAMTTVAALAGSAAWAGAPAGSWYVAPQALHVDPDNAYQADSAVGASIGIGKVLSEDWDMDLNWVDTSHDVTGGGNKLKLDGAMLNFNRVFMRDNVVNPFIGFGVNSMHSKDLGSGNSQRDFGAQIQAGVLADVLKDGALQLSAVVGKRSDDFTQHLEDVYAGLGLRFNFGATKAAPPPPPAPTPPPAAVAPAPAPTPAAPPSPADTDGDGVLDPQDRCPNTVAGAKVDANGCEIDSDKDGVVDRLDKCPTTPMGDKVDASGCSYNIPLQIQFDTNKATIKPVSNGELDKFVQFLKDVPSAKGELQGHTDSDGSAKANMSLSQRRADAVKAYIVDKGIDGARITAKGYGETMPVADNKTAEGKAANRRVVFVRSDVNN
jgi:OmpA-OmpF porin, OOP family